VAESHSLGRNDPCHCGSGRKYKQCCLDKDEQKAREARAKELADAPPPPQEEAEARSVRTAPRHGADKPWKRGAQNTRGFQKMSTPRKVGGG
jgi:hypothetical protein